MCKHFDMIDGVDPLPRDWQDASNMFLALGDERRQRILLMFAPGERLNVTHIVAGSTLSRTTISQHKKNQHQENTQENKKNKKEVYFWINKAKIAATLERVLNYVRNN